MKVTSSFALLRWLAAVTLGLVFSFNARATTVIPPDFDQLVNESDYIIRAVVKSVDSAYQTNAANRKIITKVTLDVQEVIAGTPPAQVVLELLGGRVGDQQMVVEGAPRFKVGDEDILFVKGNGQTIVPLVAMMHGRYPVMKEAATGRKYMARENKVPLTNTAEISQPITKENLAVVQESAKAVTEALTPEEFIQKIKAAINSNYVHAKP